MLSVGPLCVTCGASVCYLWVAAVWSYESTGGCLVECGGVEG